MKKKGFTLIELLAVIVILAIIAVIATPIITGIIEDAKKAAFERSVEGIIKGTETDVALKLGNEGYTYKIENGVINNLNSNIKISNTDGFNGFINYDGEANVSYAIHNDKWCVVNNGEEVITSEYNGKCEMPIIPFSDGYIIYYDVTTGSICDNYHEDNSLTGYDGTSSTKTTANQNGCLKFYSFNYDEGDNVVNLLLDHNTTDITFWTNSSTNTNINGPITLLTKLKKSTNSWVGTEPLANYTVSQEGCGNYTIPYSDENYKARLITANEVAEITGNTTFDEITTNFNNSFYFDSNAQDESPKCKEQQDLTGCNYGWLYDRTQESCENAGCLNNANKNTEAYGYWTATSSLGDASSTVYAYTSLAWNVGSGGYLGIRDVDNGYDSGVRPVIEVLKSKLQ